MPVVVSTHPGSTRPLLEAVCPRGNTEHTTSAVADGSAWYGFPESRQPTCVTLARGGMGCAGAAARARTQDLPEGCSQTCHTVHTALPCPHILTTREGHGP